VAHEVWQRNLYVFLERNIISIPLQASVEDMVEIDMATGWGCIAPYSLRKCGIHGLVCLSDAGVRAWPSQSELSGDIDESLKIINEDLQAKHRLRAAWGFYNSLEDSYNLLITSPDSLYETKYQNDEWWVYFFQTQKWGKRDIIPRASIGWVVNYVTSGRRLIVGTYSGYCWYCGNENGHGADRHDGTITTVNSTTKFTDSAAAFTNTGLKLKQFPVYIISGDAAGQRRIISDNDATSITVEVAWSPACAEDDAYIVCAARGRFTTPWLHLGDPHRQKVFPELHFSLNADAVDKNYEIKLYRDFNTAVAKTLRGTFRDQNCIVPLDIRARHLKIEINVICNDDRPAFRAIKLIPQLGTYA